MKTWTIDEMLAERPCPDYDRERITELWAERERLSLAEILDLDITVVDRLWVSYLSGAITPEQERRRTDRIVTRAVTMHALHCGIVAVESWAARWLSGADRSASAAQSAAQSEWAQSAWAAAAEREQQLADLRAVLREEAPDAN